MLTTFRAVSRSDSPTGRFLVCQHNFQQLRLVTLDTFATIQKARRNGQELILVTAAKFLPLIKPCNIKECVSKRAGRLSEIRRAAFSPLESMERETAHTEMLQTRVRQCQCSFLAPSGELRGMAKSEANTENLNSTDKSYWKRATRQRRRSS